MQLKDMNGTKLLESAGRQLFSRVNQGSFLSIRPFSTRIEKFGLLGETDAEKEKLIELQYLPEENKEAKKRKRANRNVGSDDEEEYKNPKTDKNVSASERRTR